MTGCNCEICGWEIKRKAENHSCCSKQCLAVKKNLEINERWLKKVPKTKQVGHNMKIERKRLYNNDYVFKKFNACRG